MEPMPPQSPRPASTPNGRSALPGIAKLRQTAIVHPSWRCVPIRIPRHSPRTDSSYGMVRYGTVWYGMVTLPSERELGVV